MAMAAVRVSTPHWKLRTGKNRREVRRLHNSDPPQRKIDTQTYHMHADGQ
jgi:hypothetical protein